MFRLKIPAELEPLRELSMNLWWSWNYQATDLFKSIDEDLWNDSGNNPVALLSRLSYEKLQELRTDKDFMAAMKQAYTSFNQYMSEANNKPKEMVAYFSMEYGLHESVKIYSGGLGHFGR